MKVSDIWDKLRPGDPFILKATFYELIGYKISKDKLVIDNVNHINEYDLWRISKGEVVDYYSSIEEFSNKLNKELRNE